MVVVMDRSCLLQGILLALHLAVPSVGCELPCRMRMPKH